MSAPESPYYHPPDVIRAIVKLEEAQAALDEATGWLPAHSVEIRTLTNAWTMLEGARLHLEGRTS